MSELTQPSQNLILRPTERGDVPAIMVMVNAAKAMLKADNSRAGIPTNTHFMQILMLGRALFYVKKMLGKWLLQQVFLLVRRPVTVR